MTESKKAPEEWRWNADPRVSRHLAYIANRYSLWDNDAVSSFYATTSTHTPLTEERLTKTFLDPTRRYSEGLNYADRIIRHAKGVTREFPSHRRDEGDAPITTWSCYEDGLVTQDESITLAASLGREGLWLNLNATTYDLQRFLQLSNEVFDDDDPFLDVVVNFQRIEKVVVPVFNSGGFVGHYEYAGYHEPIILRVSRTEISNREGWNQICPPVRQLLKKISNIFGLADIPQTYWDSDGQLDYSKFSSSRR